MLTRMLALRDRVLGSTDIFIPARLRRRHRLVKRGDARCACEQPKLTPRIGKMCRKAPPRLHRTREIVMLLAGLWRRMLEDAGDQANLLRCVHSQKRRRGSTEVVKTHGFSKFDGDPRTNHVIDVARAQRPSPIRCPEPIMRAAIDQDRSYLLQIVHDVGKELLRYPEGFPALRFGIRRMQENIDARFIELKVAGDCESGKG